MISATTLAGLIAAFQAIVTEIPAAIGLAKEFKEFITGLFQKGLISADTQNAVHAHVDEIIVAVVTGEVPPAWQEEPDPVDPPKPVE